MLVYRLNICSSYAIACTSAMIVVLKVGFFSDVAFVVACFIVTIAVLFTVVIVVVKAYTYLAALFPFKLPAYA